MSKYIIKRLIQMVPVVLGVTLIVFVILSFTPGDPARMILGQKATDEQVQVLQEQLGLNKPVLVRYANYMIDVLRGNLGRSYSAKVEVTQLIKTRIPNTLKLGFLSLIVQILIAIPLGVLTAVKQNTIFDNIMRVVTLAVAGMPVFWLGLLLIILFSVKLGLLPASGLQTPSSYILPVICMCSAGIAITTRLTRASFLDVIRQDYIRTARAKGLKENIIMRKHALKNALLPIVTSLGMAIPCLFAGSVLIESVFGINGIGKLMVDHIRQKDIPTVMSCILLLAIIIALSNLITDLAYAFIDPRIKGQYIKPKKKEVA